MEIKPENKRVKRTSVVEGIVFDKDQGIVFDKDQGIAFVNLPTKQIWVPSKGVSVGDKIRVTVEIVREREVKP
jgi:ABC-type molybdate transport system ATPase subunit